MINKLLIEIRDHDVAIEFFESAFLRKIKNFESTYTSVSQTVCRGTPLCRERFLSVLRNFLKYINPCSATAT